MDQEAYLTRLLQVHSRFSALPQNALSSERAKQNRAIRPFLSHDSTEQTVFQKLFLEAVEQLITNTDFDKLSTAVLINRSGCGNDVYFANKIVSILAAIENRPSFLQVSFNTPVIGLGSLVKNGVTKTALDLGIEAEVSILDFPIETISISFNETEYLLGNTAPIISYASLGSSSIIPENMLFKPDFFLQRSHVAVLSFLEPEALCAEIPRFYSIMQRESSISSVRFRVKVAEDEQFFDFGAVTLSDNQEEAQNKLYAVIEDVRKRRFAVFVEPAIKNDKERIYLVCPCRSLVEDPGFLKGVKVIKIVPCGAILSVTVQGAYTVFS